MNTQATQANNVTALPTFVERAANAFLLIQVSIGQWKGVKRNERAERDAAKAAHLDAALNQEGRNKAHRSYVNLLGRNHDKLREVQSAFTAIRTFIYENTLHTDTAGTGQRRGMLLLAANDYPRVAAGLKKLASEAEAALHEFLKDYEQFRAEALTDMPHWLSASDFPEPSEVLSKFYVRIPPPQTLSVPDVSKMNLPVEMADKIMAQATESIRGQLDAAKENLLEQAMETMDRVHKQLTVGKRLRESLAPDAKRVGERMIQIGTSLGDPRITAIGKEITEKVANVDNTESWKNSYIKKDSAVKFSEKARLDIAKMQHEMTAQASPAAGPAKDDGTLMVDLF